MERLTGLEFLAATDGPHVVRLKNTLYGERALVLQQYGFVAWLGVDLSSGPLLFLRREDLVIEGQGIARPYWNDEPLSWTTHFDADAESERIALIQTAARRQLTAPA